MTEVGSGPKGTRVIVDVASVEVASDKVNATLAPNDAADWLTLSADWTIACLDVRFTLNMTTVNSFT